jgi:peptide/nickel transport system permease protein
MQLAKFIAYQLARGAALLLAVALVVFALVSFSPVDPVQANVGQAALLGMSEEKRAALAAYWGADTSFVERFTTWLANLAQGDMGTSLRYNAPVLEVIAQRASNSFMLLLVAWVISGVLGFALGVVAALNEGRWPDKLIRGYCFVLAATPTFWIGLMLLVVFSVWLGWFPIGFAVPVSKAAAEVTLADALHHMALPAITLSVVGVANVALHTRVKAQEVLASPYARFSAARGFTPAQFMRRHGFRNIALPALTLQFAQIAEIISGSVLVEQVFSYPGLGQAAVTAGLGGDAELLVGIAVFTAAVVFAGNVVVNVLYQVVDPRLRGASDAYAVGKKKQAAGTSSPFVFRSSYEEGERHE